MIGTEEDALHLLCVKRQTRILPSSKGTGLVATDGRGYVQIRPLLERDSTQEWIIASAIIHASPNMPSSVIVRNPTNALLSLEKHQRISTALPSAPAIIHNKFDEPSLNISSRSVCQSVNFSHHQPDMVSFKQIVNHEQVSEEEGTRRTEDR